MASNTEAVAAFEVLRWEPGLFHAREKVTIASGQGTIAVGQILEASGSNKIKVGTAANADSIALEAVDATSAAKECVAAVRNCVVNKDMLNYNSMTVATVDTALKALGIVPRSGPTYTTL